MLSFSGSLRVFVAVEACDMRKGFEGLSALVGSVLKEEVKSGALFAFSNRRRTRLKILYWDGSGLWVLSKRLEKGTFAWPKPGDGVGGKLPLRAEALSMLLSRQFCRGVIDQIPIDRYVFTVRKRNSPLPLDKVVCREVSAHTCPRVLSISTLSMRYFQPCCQSSQCSSYRCRRRP